MRISVQRVQTKVMVTKTNYMLNIVIRLHCTADLYNHMMGQNGQHPVIDVLAALAAARIAKKYD